MRNAIDETNRRRAKQVAFNKANGIVPRSVSKGIKDMIDGVYDLDDRRAGLATEKKAAQDRKRYDVLSVKQLETAIKRVEREMVEAARDLEFEKAAESRDELRMLRNKLLLVGGADSSVG